MNSKSEYSLENIKYFKIKLYEFEVNNLESILD